MSSVLGDNAEKWMEIVLSFLGDPSKYGIPKKIFELPEVDDNSIESYLNYAENKWQDVEIKAMNPYNDIDNRVPFWMVFTLPRKPAMLFLAVWDNVWEQRDRELYQDLHYNFQELIQNFIREYLRLFKTVRPFRLKTGSSVLSIDSGIDEELKPEVQEHIKRYTSPQKVLHDIAHFVRDKTIQAGIAYIMLIERLSNLIAKTKTPTQIEKVTRKFQNEIDRLKQTDFDEILPATHEVEDQSLMQDIKTTQTIEFFKVKLQEYDGYVEIQGYSDDENRNFRIYDCIEEDLLREEIWKNRRYPLRRIVDEILDEKYSRPNKKYTLKYGVKIKLLEPNWK